MTRNKKLFLKITKKCGNGEKFTAFAGYVKNLLAAYSNNINREN
jgi:hypothetical protein